MQAPKGESKEGVAGSSGLNVWGGLLEQGCYNMPRRAPSGGLWFDGTYFSEYKAGSSGWVSNLLDPLLQEAITSAKVGDKPLLYICDAVQIALQRHEAALAASAVHDTLPPTVAQLLMYVPPQGELEELKGHTGGFFDLHVLFDHNVINVFSLLEEGRRLQRSLVYSSDSRFAMRHLVGDAADRDKPFSPGCRYAAGNIFESVLTKDGNLQSRPGAGKHLGQEVGSLVISRSRNIPQSQRDTAATASSDALKWSGGYHVPLERDTETYVTDRALFGLVPEALIQQYQFWRTGPLIIRGCVI